MAPYTHSKTEPSAVLRDQGPGATMTYVVHPHEQPNLPGWKVADLMNLAYRHGYAKAQADIRAAINCTPY